MTQRSSACVVLSYIVSSGMRHWSARVYECFVHWVWTNRVKKETKSDIERVELACHWRGQVVLCTILNTSVTFGKMQTEIKMEKKACVCPRRRGTSKSSPNRPQRKIGKYRTPTAEPPISYQKPTRPKLVPKKTQTLPKNLNFFPKRRPTLLGGFLGEKMLQMGIAWTKHFFRCEIFFRCGKKYYDLCKNRQNI